MTNDITREILELKIDNVFFLGSTCLTSGENTHGIVFAVKVNFQFNINILFKNFKKFSLLLKSPLPKPVISCYQNLSVSISNALKKEEIDNKYLSQQSKKILELIDHQDQLLNKSLFNILKKVNRK